MISSPTWGQEGEALSWGVGQSPTKSRSNEPTESKSKSLEAVARQEDGSVGTDGKTEAGGLREVEAMEREC